MEILTGFRQRTRLGAANNSVTFFRYFDEVEKSTAVGEAGVPAMPRGDDLKWWWQAIG